MKLSAVEKKIIEVLRKQKEVDKVKKIGFSKENLYQTKSMGNVPAYLSEAEKEQYIKRFKASIVLSIPAGSKFECYIENGCESWYDTANGSISAADANWAKKHLKKY